MKILAIGDYHGTFPSKFKNIIKKEKIDLIVSIGDYLPFHYRKLWFKHCYGKDVELWEIIGKKKYRKLVLEDVRKGEVPIKKLNQIGIPVYTVLGNVDYPSADDVMDEKESRNKSMPNYNQKDSFLKKLKNYKNIHRFDYSYLKFGNYVFIGMRGHSNPGRVKSKAFKKHKKILEKLFKKFKKENKERRVIFVSHNILYNTKLDKITSKDAHTKAKGKHFGSKLARRIVDQYKPLLHFGGHIHESYGKQKVGKSVCINVGAAHEGKAAIIELDDKKGKINKIKLIR